MNPYKKGLGLVAAMIFAGAASKPKYPEMPPPPKPRPLTFESEINPTTEAVAPGVAKEPWQMQYREFFDIAGSEYTAGERFGVPTKNRVPVDPSTGFGIKGAVSEERIHRAVLLKALSEGKPVPPEVLADYPDLARAVPKAEALKPPVAEAQAQASMEAQAGTGCIPCGKAHLNRVAGLLEEAMRFARREGLGHPEVVRRVDMAERELANMEAVDLTPENMAKLPPEQKEIAEWALTKGREIRHFLDEMNAQSPVSELERTAVRASEIATEYRARTWGISPEVMKKLMQKAEAVRRGEISKEQALSELKMEVR